jgi:hypothetical protein
MPPYQMMDLRDLLFMFAVGLVLTIAVVLARTSRSITFPYSKKEDKVHEFGGGVTEGQGRVPVLIWVVFVGYFIWAAAYILYSGVTGV